MKYIFVILSLIFSFSAISEDLENKKKNKFSFESILFHNWKDGVSFMNKVARSNLIPASSRLMDNSMVRFASALKAEKVGSEKVLNCPLPVKIKNKILIPIAPIYK